MGYAVYNDAFLLLLVWETICGENKPFLQFSFHPSSILVSGAKVVEITLPLTAEEEFGTLNWGAAQ